MSLDPPISPRSAADPLIPAHAEFVLEKARVLERAAAVGRLDALLRGKNLALMCDREDSPEAVLFRRAASALGARVSPIRPLAADADPQVVRDTARMLGRLYDAVECQGLPALLVQTIRAEAGVPVYDELSCLALPTETPVRALADTDAAAARCAALQTLLLSTIT